MNEDTQIPDTDFHNVWQDVKSVVRLSQEALEKPREGMHGIHKAKLDELADAQSRLERDMHTLVNSPYTQLHEPPPIELSREAVTALRALWTILEDMKELPMDQRSCKDKELARAMQRAILSLNPNYEFNGNDFDEDMADKTDAPTTRRSERPAGIARKRYNYDEDGDDSMADLIGESGDDESGDEDA